MLIQKSYGCMKQRLILEAESFGRLQSPSLQEGQVFIKTFANSKSNDLIKMSNRGIRSAHSVPYLCFKTE